MRKVFITAAIIFCSAIGVKAQSSYDSTTNHGTNTSAFGVNSTNSSVRYQSGYTRKDGTYVQGHYKTTNNGTNHDNYSTRGSVNSFTGSTGSRARDYSSDAYNYGAGRTIYTGSRGGQYYINSRGNKVYVPKR